MTSYFEVERQIHDLLKLGVIRESNSAYAHPIVSVKKKNGDIRMAVDLRLVNSGTVNNAYTMKCVDDLLSSLSGSDFMTSLDCTQGYYQIPMDPEIYIQFDLCDPHWSI